MLMTIDRKVPTRLKIGDVVGVAEMIAPDEATARYPAGACCHEEWPADWYAVLTKPGRESGVDARLSDQGYRSFLPKRLVEIRVPGFQRKRETVMRPLYPRYVFAGVPTDILELGPVYNTRGVSTVLSDAGGAMRIRHEVMAELFDRADANGVVEITEVPADHLFAEGQVVHFRAKSPFNPFEGTIVRVDSNGMIKVHVDSPVRAWPVDVHYSDLLPPEPI